jgi:iron complex transport system substrate-binding protein
MLQPKKKIVILLAMMLVVVSVLAACGSSTGGSGSSAPAESTNAAAYNVTDLAGRTVELAGAPIRALAIAGPSYEKVFLLGQADRLAGAHFYMLDRPWVVETNPNIKDVNPVESPGEPNIEDLLTLEPDVAFFFDYPDSLTAMVDAGIPTLVVQQSEGNPTTADAFLDYQKKEVQVFADAFGAEAQAKAADWFAYLDEKVAYVQDKVKDIPAADRKTALYAYGEDGLGVFSQYSYVSFWLELAGGRNLADETGQEMDTIITMEQIIDWDPDFYFMGRMETTEPVTSDAKWAELKAVKNGNVYICPDGVMYWDYSSEGVLLMEYLAQKMYPELFADLDMVAETQEYYQTFYGYTLSAENAQRILDHLPPVGA